MLDELLRTAGIRTVRLVSFAREINIAREFSAFSELLDIVSNAIRYTPAQARSGSRGVSTRWHGRVLRHRFGHRHCPGARAAIDRALLPCGPLALARDGGHRARPCHRQARPPAPSGRPRDRERARQGQYVLGTAAGEARATRGASGRSRATVRSTRPVRLRASPRCIAPTAPAAPDRPGNSQDQRKPAARTPSSSRALRGPKKSAPALPQSRVKSNRWVRCPRLCADSALVDQGVRKPL